MRVRLKGVNSVTKKLSDGTIAIYHYHRATNTRLEGDPGSAKFVASYSAAEATLRARANGVLVVLMRQYTSSTEFSKLAVSTQSEYKRLLKSAEGEFGDMPISALDDPRVKSEFLDWRDKVAKSSGEREADNRLTALSSMISWWVGRGKLATNHLKGFKRLYHSDRQDIIWLPEHIDKFMDAADADMQEAMILALHSGQREGDLIRLAWSAYDGEHIWVRPGKETRHGKKGMRRAIKCTQTLKRMLDGMKRTGPIILSTKTGQPFKKRYFVKRWSDTMKKAGIEIVQLPDMDHPVRLHVHDVRGTTVTLLAEAGSTVPEIAAITGHSIKTVHNIIERYLKLTRGLSDSAIFKFEESAKTAFARSLKISTARK